MNIKGRLGGRGLREQQLKHVCAETEGGSGSQAAQSGMGGHLHTDFDAQGKFSGTRKFKTPAFSFLQLPGNCWSLQCIPGPGQTLPSCHCLRPQTFFISQPAGNLSAA